VSPIGMGRLYAPCQCYNTGVPTKKKALGRGLQALAKDVQIPGVALSDAVGKTRPPSELPIAAIAPNPYQPRMEVPLESLETLIDSIRRHGVMEPILVRPKAAGYELVAGQRRLLAAKEAGLSSIPAVVQDLTDEQVLVLSLVENLQREDLNPADEARAFQMLHGRFGLTHEEIGEAVGRGRTYVTNSLRLLVLEKPVLDALASGRLTRGQGLALLAVPHTSRADVMKLIEHKGLTVRQIEDFARHAPKLKDAVKQAAVNPHLERVAQELEESLGAKVRVQPRKKGGDIVIAYESTADLNRLLRLLLRRESPY
jgi:ParB family transcriptional regulator, chromosome partitioning protein